MKKQPYYITTPIYYVNDKPHIGHAYTTIACDVLARFKRWQGYDVFFLTGTDEHGQKVEQSAAKAAIPPQEFCDTVSANFRQLAVDFNISNNDFIRTTEPRHIKAAQALWNTLCEKGQIYAGSYAGWYSVRDEAYYQENELIEGLAPTGAPVEWVEEPSYFFKLSDWQEPLLRYYAENTDFILPASRRNEVISFVKSGLKDLSISRTTFSWGVPVPLRNAGDEKHIMYVWLDALTNYLTAIGYPQNTSAYWPASLHMVGKDILRFHAVYWPAFLMAANLPLPKRVFAHGWWTNEGKKISKSVGNVIDPYSLKETYGLDAVRYFLLRQVPFGQDGDFSHREMIRRLNSELANDFGNLCQRVLSFIQKNAGAVIPQQGTLAPQDSTFLEKVYHLEYPVSVEMDSQAFHNALEIIWNVIGEANRYIDKEAPWSLRKTDPARMETVLYVLLEVIRCCAMLAMPFMPQSCNAILDMLAIPQDKRQSANFGKAGALQSGIALPAPHPVFPRFIQETEAKENAD